MAEIHTIELPATWASRTDRPWCHVEGSAVLADLSGFTRLTEALVATGAEGVEVLHRSLTTCFDALLDHSVELGGDVIGFAGDAALVWFEGDDHVTRAARAAAAMPSELAAIPSVMTGRVKLRASVGLHSGEFLFVLGQSRGRHGLFICGPTMTTLARLEAAADPMQVLMSAEAAAGLPASWRGDTLDGGIVLERRNIRRGRRGLPAAPIGQLTSGEHRVASIGFLLVPGTDDVLAAEGPDALAARIRQVTDVVVRECDEHAVTWLDTDVGANCVKFLLAAGLPRAVDDDDARLVSALRRIVDDSPVPLRAGAQRGRVFSGLLGVRSRHTYTALGDTTNVAARAMGKAGDREVIAADGLGVERQRWITTEAMGLQQLKNRAAPMDMWRVVAVDERPRAPLRRHASTAPLFRRDEWEDLARAWKATADGTGASLALVGEPGMGASELVAELTDLAGGEATSIVADRFARHVPYAGVRSLVHALASATGGDSGDGGWTWLAGFAPRLPPSMRAWAPAALSMVRGEDLPTIDPRTASRRARQVLAALLQLAAPRPWLLAVEDVDQLDDASRQVIDDLSGGAVDGTHLLVTTLDVGSTAPPSARPVLLDALDDRVATEILLELAPHLRDNQVARIVAAAGGNPFVMAELITHLDSDELPDSLQRLGAMLIDSLPADVRALVLDASVFGMQVDLPVAANVLGRPELDSDAPWRDARAVLRPAGASTMRFRNAALHRACYETLTFRRRRELHGTIAGLLRSHTDRADALLALHLRAAGRDHEAYPVTVAAAAAAKATGALVEAVDLYASAVTMARRIDPAAVGTLSVELGEARLWSGDVDGATAAYTAAGRALTDPLQLAHLYHLRADLALSRHQVRAARRWVDQGTAIASRLGDEATDVRIHLLLHEAVVLDLQGRHAPALVPAEHALALAEAAGRRELVGLAHLQLEVIRFALTQREALEHGEAAIEIFTEIGDDRRLGRALGNSGLFAMYLGRWDEAGDLYARARVHAERCGHAADVALTDLNTGFLRYRQRRFDEAEQLARRSRRALAAANVDSLVGYATLLQAMIAAQTDRLDDAAEQLAAARALFASTGDDALVVDCDVVGLDIALHRGEPDLVLREARSIEARLAVAEAEVAVSFGRIVGLAEARCGDGEAGAVRIAAALARARELHLLYEVYLCLGALAEVAGDGGVADEHAALGAALGVETAAELEAGRGRA